MRMVTSQHGNKGEGRGEDGNHSLQEQVLNRRCIILNAVSDVIGAATIMHGETKPLRVEKQLAAEIVYKLLARVGGEQPACQRLQTVQHCNHHQQGRTNHQRAIGGGEPAVRPGGA